MSKKTPEPSAEAAESAQRLDKWLWYARLVKTRTLAAKVIETGKVRINSTRVKKPARLVRTGDVITTTLNHRLRVVKILAPGERRGPASEAQNLYEDMTPPLATNTGDRPPAPAKVGAREAGSGRPTKRERREISRLKAWRI